MASVTICSDFGAPKNKVCHCFHCFPICHEVMGPDAMILVFWMLNLSQLFHFPLSLSSRGSLVFLHFLPLWWCHLCIWRRQWQPTLVLLSGKSHGWRSLVGCSPRGRWESDTTERFHFHFSLSCIGEGNGNPLQCSCLENPRDGGA